jgi:hypothetical protein
MKPLIFALCLAAFAMPLQAEESVVGTAWQCGRDYLEITHFGLGGAAQEAQVWPNKKGPYGDGEELMLRQLGRPSAYQWKNGNLYYRSEPCAKRKPPKEQK